MKYEIIITRNDAVLRKGVLTNKGRITDDGWCRGFSGLSTGEIEDKMQVYGVWVSLKQIPTIKQPNAAEPWYLSPEGNSQLKQDLEEYSKHVLSLSHYQCSPELQEQLISLYNSGNKVVEIWKDFNLSWEGEKYISHCHETEIEPPFMFGKSEPVTQNKQEKELGVINVNKMALDQMAKYLSDKYRFSSSMEAKCIHHLIKFYEDGRREGEAAKAEEERLEHYKITGFNTPDEWRAYEKGRMDEQGVIFDWIKKWDGSTNSSAGKILSDKFAERTNLLENDLEMAIIKIDAGQYGSAKNFINRYINSKP